MNKTTFLIALAVAMTVVTFVAYSYALEYVAGYLDMTLWSNPQTKTNITAGLVGMFLIFGGILGYFVPKKILYKLSPQRRRLITVCITSTLVMLFCYMLSIAGVPGFRW